jgi:hypothetical protein
MSQTAFEVYGRGFGWSWRLRGPLSILATGSKHYEASSEARSAVNRVRAAVATINRDDDSFRGTSIADPRIVIEQEPTPAGDLPPDRNNWVWRVAVAGGVLGHSADRFQTSAEAESASERFLELASGALPMFLVGAEYDWKTGPKPIEVGAASLGGLVTEVVRGIRHRRTLDGIETKIVVSGTRGKSSTTRRLDDVFNRRGYDTLTKITGDHPTLIHNGEARPIERQGPRTTLYENISLIADFAPELDAYEPEDVAIFENQGITEYTTRLFNRRLARPDVIVLTNVRQDHTDTLGKTRTDIARAFARSVPAGTHVISGEQHPILHAYLEDEIERRGGTIEQVDIPGRQEGMLGAETIHSIDAVLEFLGESSLPTGEIDASLAAMQPSWMELEKGRIFDAAAVNDVESTEMVRQLLADGDTITPFVYLRRDRRGRTASFASYIEGLFERGLIDEAHVAGANSRAFVENVDGPTHQYDRQTSADDLIDALLASGRPAILMGNTVDEFMRDLQESLEDRVLHP